jgi:membrane peptidoglycan carboxypeptidase
MGNKKKLQLPRIGRSSQSSRKSKNTFTTKSGQNIKIHRNIVEKLHARRDAKARKRAIRLAGMPKSRVKRFFYRLHPKRLYKYWFSREGLVMGLKITGIGIVAGFLTLIGLFAYFRKDLPNLRDISGNNIGGSIRYYDRTGETLLWEDYDAVKRIPVRGDVAKVMVDATIAVEDKDFFNHGGFDVRGISRAAVNNAFGGEGTVQGGSTITQQLVKLTQNWTNERTYTRKIKELILSVELERTYSKQEILHGYLDTAPYGDITYGVEAASQDYFHKSAKDLTLDEAAFLAAMPQSPTYYSPYGARYNKEALLGRQQYILDLMLEQGKITKEEREAAKTTDTLAKIKPRKPKYEGIQAPWFVLTAKEHLQERCKETVQCGGWKVITTLDLDLQKKAEEQVQKGLTQVRRQGGDSAAFVAEDVKTGQVVALVGGDDFNNPNYGQNNYARAKLPPGSSIKPYDYLALIEHTDQFGAGSVLYDTKGPIDGYPCTTAPTRTGNCAIDYDLRFPGPLTLRYALGGSRNIPAMKAMLIAGVDKTIETANKMMGAEDHGYSCYLDEQLTEKGPCYASSAIGDGAYLQLDEHVHGFATLSRNGNRVPQTYILKIEDASGKTVDEWKAVAGEQVVRDEAAYIVTDMLTDPKASYLSRKPHNYKGHKIAYKTGTTNDSKDGWMMSYSPHYAAGVWVGYHDRSVEMRGFMENMTQPILQGWMQAAHDNAAPEDWPRPAGLQVLPAFVVRNHVGVGSVEPSPATDLYPSWFKKKLNNKKQTIDKVSNKLATECTPARAREEVTGGSAANFSGDRFVNQGASTEEKDDVHKCEDTRPSISISTSPQGSGFLIGATVAQGTHPLSSDRFPGTVSFSIDGQVIHTVQVSGSGPVASFSYTPTFTGTKTITAEIVDSVLYDASDSAQITASSGGGGALTITEPEDGDDVGPNTNVKWTGGAGPYTVTVDGVPWPSCISINATSCNGVVIPGANDSTHVIVVTGSSGADSVTVKR